MESLSYAFNWNSEAVQGMLKDFDKGTLSKRFENANSAHWLIGHLAASRRMICGILAVETEPAEWTETFDMGSSPEVPDRAPSPSELLDDFLETGQNICTKVEAMSPDDFGKPMQMIAGNEEGTVLHNLQFMYWHESYHMGQLGMIRSMAGLERMA